MKMSKILWGLLIIGCGVMLLLAALGLGEEYEVVRIIGSVILLGIAIFSIVNFRFFFVVLPLSLIAYLWRVQLGFPDLDIWLLLAAAVVLGIGLSIVFHKKHRPFHRLPNKKDWSSTTEKVTGDGEVVNISSSFGEHTKYIHTDGLRQVNINGSFCSIKVYFDQCRPSSEGLVVNVSSHFAGVVLVMPRAWYVENHINTFAAEVVDRDGAYDPESARIVLNGSINFAEIKILRV